MCKNFQTRCAHDFPNYAHFFSTGCAKFWIYDFMKQKKYFYSPALLKNNY